MENNPMGFLLVLILSGLCLICRFRAVFGSMRFMRSISYTGCPDGCIIDLKEAERIT